MPCLRLKKVVSAWSRRKGKVWFHMPGLREGKILSMPCLGDGENVVYAWSRRENRLIMLDLRQRKKYCPRLLGAGKKRMTMFSRSERKNRLSIPSLGE